MGIAVGALDARLSLPEPIYIEGGAVIAVALSKLLHISVPNIVGVFSRLFRVDFAKEEADQLVAVGNADALGRARILFGEECSH